MIALARTGLSRRPPSRRRGSARIAALLALLALFALASTAVLPVPPTHAEESSDPVPENSEGDGPEDESTPDPVVVPSGSDGLFLVSALDVAASPNLLPAGGSVAVSLTVRNLSTKKLSGTADFWITTLWGTRVSALPTAEVADLAAGETRTLTAHLDGPGQWALYTAHATFAPDTVVENGSEAQSRDAFLFFPPLFAFACLLLIAVALVVLRFALRRRAAYAPSSEEVPAS
ncbi:hypothetical protein J4H92_12860 [Leucobacter weissii]|uniref:DUF916 domain-containing protein n=1 Tax=Leucobacter weissii TaxID=1983706 RepID=A0A939MLM7_9MICO|nr:hypothetical protein [Leucobacter weissii]MBO1902836.1 hypothetical protein [Leucobacter weissii]